jgi:hypothetical protein
VRWLSCISELKSYADGSRAADRVIEDGQILSELSNKEGHPGLPHWGGGLMNPYPKNTHPENPKTMLVDWNNVTGPIQHKDKSLG